MPIGASTTQTAANALKTVYKEPIQIQLNTNVSPWYAAVEKLDKTPVSDQFVFVPEYGRQGAIGARPENTTLPNASPRSNVQILADTKNIFGRIQISDKLLKTSAISARAFGRELTRQMTQITQDAKDMLTRNLSSNHFGVFGYLNAAGATAATTLTLNANTSIVDAFYSGQIIDIGTYAAGAFTLKATAQIADIDKDTGVITLTAGLSAAVANGDAITLAGDFGYELVGLDEILTKDNLIYNINRANNKWFNPHVSDKTNAGATVALDSIWMEKIKNDIRISSGKDPNFFIMDYGVQRAYIEEQREFNRSVNTQTVDGGFLVYEYGGVPISPEPYFKKNAIGVLTTDDFTLARIDDWAWMDEDGALLSRVGQTDTYEAALTLYANLVVRRSNSQGIILGITEVN